MSCEVLQKVIELETPEGNKRFKIIYSGDQKNIKHFKKRLEKIRSRRAVQNKKESFQEKIDWSKKGLIFIPDVESEVGRSVTQSQIIEIPLDTESQFTSQDRREKKRKKKKKNKSESQEPSQAPSEQ